MITLKAADVIRNARAAFDKGELQIQKGPMEFCSYSGPCAIGVSVPIELRKQFDGVSIWSTSITGLIDDGFVKTDSENTLEQLQSAHDSGDIELFENTLKELERL